MISTSPSMKYRHRSLALAIMHYTTQHCASSLCCEMSGYHAVVGFAPLTRPHDYRVMTHFGSRSLGRQVLFSASWSSRNAPLRTTGAFRMVVVRRLLHGFVGFVVFSVFFWSCSSPLPYSSFDDRIIMAAAPGGYRQVDGVWVDVLLARLLRWQICFCKGFA
ncbi:hypothetical protein L209DRAFT_596959 [Thermothelomyces heterothallicus CBS 203.75]